MDDFGENSVEAISVIIDWLAISVPFPRSPAWANLPPGGRGHGVTLFSFHDSQLALVQLSVTINLQPPTILYLMTRPFGLNAGSTQFLAF